MGGGIKERHVSGKLRRSSVFGLDGTSISVIPNKMEISEKQENKRDHISVPHSLSVATSKQHVGVARLLSTLCLSVGVLSVLRPAACWVAGGRPPKGYPGVGAEFLHSYWTPPIATRKGESVVILYMIFLRARFCEGVKFNYNSPMVKSRCNILFLYLGYKRISFSLNTLKNHTQNQNTGLKNGFSRVGFPPLVQKNGVFFKKEGSHLELFCLKTMII